MLRFAKKYYFNCPTDKARYFSCTTSRVSEALKGRWSSEIAENDQDEFGSLDDILEGKSAWAVHFSTGKPMTTTRPHKLVKRAS